MKIAFWHKDKPKAVGGAEARARAEEALKAAKEHRARADRVVSSLESLGMENHFSGKIEHLIRKGMG